MLVTVNEAISSMGLSQSLATDLKGVVTSSILKAQQRLNTELGTTLEVATCTDIFFLDSDIFAGVVPDGVFRLKLVNMFVHSNTVVVKYGSTINTMTTTITPSAIDAEQGVVFLPIGYDKVYISVEYTSGLEDGSAPEGIKQSVLLFASMSFSASVSAGSSGGDKVSPESGKRTGDLAQGVLGRYKRITPFCYQPLVHNQVLAA